MPKNKLTKPKKASSLFYWFLGLTTFFVVVGLVISAGSCVRTETETVTETVTNTVTNAGTNTETVTNVIQETNTNVIEQTLYTNTNTLTETQIVFQYVSNLYDGATGMVWESTGVTLPSIHATRDVTLTSFENPPYMLSNGWAGTGAFTNTATTDIDGWKGTSGAARVGSRAISTCEIAGGDCNDSSGSLTSPAIKATRNYLNFLVSGSYNPLEIYVSVMNTNTGQFVGWAAPRDNGPSYVATDLHWRSVWLGDSVDNYIVISIVDNASGFISVDHFFMSDTPWGFFGGSGELFTGFGDDALLQGADVLPVGSYNLSTGGLSGVIFDFDDHRLITAEEGWLLNGGFTTGERAGFSDNFNGPGVAFGTNADGGIAGAAIGSYRISTCEGLDGGCDSGVGTLTSPGFFVTKRYLNFLMSGGSDGDPDAKTNGTATATPNIEMRLYVNGDATAAGDTASNAVLRFTPRNCGGGANVSEEPWHTIDVSAYIGQELQLQLHDAEAGGCGFLTFDHLYESDVAGGDLRATL